MVFVILGRVLQCCWFVRLWVLIFVFMYQLLKGVVENCNLLMFSYILVIIGMVYYFKFKLVIFG